MNDKSSNYNSVTLARFHANRASTCIMMLNEDAISNSDKSEIKVAEQHLRQASRILDKVSKSV